MGETPVNKPQIIGHVEKTLDWTSFDCKWIPSSARFVVIGCHNRNTGALQIYEIAQGNIQLIKETEKGTAFKCGTFGASSFTDRHLATGDFSGNLTMWDLENLHVPVFNIKGHSEIINCIDGIGGMEGEGAPEIITGSRDGLVKVWDPRQTSPVAVIQPCEGQVKRDCWSVAFGNAFTSDDRVVATAYDNGDVKLFDLRSMALRWETNLKNGVCSLEFDRKDVAMKKLVATTTESQFHVFDMTADHPEKGLVCKTDKAHKATVWLARHLPQNREVFMTLDGNGGLNLWKSEHPKEGDKGIAGKHYIAGGEVRLLSSSTLSTQAICGFDWHPDKQGLAVATAFDQTLRVVIVTRLNSL